MMVSPVFLCEKGHMTWTEVNVVGTYLKNVQQLSKLHGAVRPILLKSSQNSRERLN